MKPKTHKDIVAISDLFERKNETFLIFGHTHPDGDTVGSGLALKEFLELKGHTTHFILPDPFPEFLAWMKGADSILIYTKEEKKIQQLIQHAAVFIFVDLNSISRLETLQNSINEVIDQKISVLFDHHINPDNVFKHSYWDTSVSSTAELIYEFILEAGAKDLISQSMAENLYVGIMTDTGSFSYSCNNPETYTVLAHLFSMGIDGAYIHQQVYNSFTEEKLRLLGHSVSARLTVMQEFGGAFIALCADDLKEHKYQVGDTEGLVNYTMTIKGIHFGALLTEMEKYIKISLRSEGDIDVNLLAHNFFNGGGHKNAAGAYFYGTLHEACEIVSTIIRKHLQKNQK
jgi:bifunctional oligoribonuclease and PAP phosphatase NrnA